MSQASLARAMLASLSARRSERMTGPVSIHSYSPLAGSYRYRNAATRPPSKWLQSTHSVASAFSGTGWTKA